MSAGDQLVLRDVHALTAPAWWPPAPGWWMLIATCVLALASYAVWRVLRKKRFRTIAALFDDAVAAADTRSGKIAAMSELLRRASRRIDADADKLQGEAWLRFLDRGNAQPVFTAGAGTLLREGGFRRDVSPSEYEALHGIARQRFVEWMTQRR